MQTTYIAKTTQTSPHAEWASQQKQLWRKCSLTIKKVTSLSVWSNKFKACWQQIKGYSRLVHLPPLLAFNNFALSQPPTQTVNFSAKIRVSRPTYFLLALAVWRSRWYDNEQLGKSYCRGTAGNSVLEILQIAESLPVGMKIIFYKPDRTRFHKQTNESQIYLICLLKKTWNIKTLFPKLENCSGGIK